MPPDPSFEQDPEFLTLQAGAEGNRVNREKIKLDNFAGDSSKFRHWATAMYSYIFNTGLQNDDIHLRLLDQHLPIGSAPQKMLESS